VGRLLPQWQVWLLLVESQFIRERERACSLSMCTCLSTFPTSIWRISVQHEVIVIRKATSEAVGTAFLLATVVGSGIMGERLAGGNVAIALLANTIATGAGLVALILTFGPISGAHFNPVVTIADAWEGSRPWREVPTYIAAQVVGALVGVAVAHGMFGEPVFAASEHVRSGPAQLLSEFVATFGLLSVIWGVSRNSAQFTPFAVGAYITAAYWFTSSTSFANPAVTLARSLTNTFSGIRPADAPAFIAAQVAGALAATVLFRFLAPVRGTNTEVPIVDATTNKEAA
jgi:glycerol uptake facilitator-like aquaporin